MNRIWYESWNRPGISLWLVPKEIKLAPDGTLEYVLASHPDNPHNLYAFTKETNSLKQIGITGDINWNTSIIPLGIEDMIGKTFISVERFQEGFKEDKKDDIILFTGEDFVYKLYSEGNDDGNCNEVIIDDIVGDLQDLVGSPLLVAELITSKHNSDKYSVPPGKKTCGEWTWSFYKFATAKGYVDIKWWGDSNGYYSETAYFKRIK